MKLQKSALKIILGDRYRSYKNALCIRDIETLNDRRQNLCLNFALKTLKHPKMKKMFPLNDKSHNMGTRKP